MCIDLFYIYIYANDDKHPKWGPKMSPTFVQNERRETMQKWQVSQLRIYPQR